MMQLDRSEVDLSQKRTLECKLRVDLNECEQFPKALLDRSEIDLKSKAI